MGLIVMKFGGTSVATAARMRQLAETVRNTAGQNAVAVVVSALAGVTDDIIKVLQVARAGSHVAVEKYCTALQTRHDELIAELLPPEERADAAAGVHAAIERLRQICSGLVQLRSSTPQVSDMALAL